MFLSLVFITGTEFIDYLPDPERKTRNNRKILQKGAVKWQKLPYQHGNFPKNRKNRCDFAR